MGKKEDLTGRRFGRLIVIAPLPKRGRYAMWFCKCDCGNTREVYESSLLGNKSKSCGCYVKERNSKHGGYKTRLYKVWTGMLIRCKPNSNGSKNYGDRGIRVCEEWHDFETFKNWAYANGYDDNLSRADCSLDRIDVNGNYEPSNCRWATAIEQNRNRRDNHLLTYRGETHCVTEWGEILGINRQTISARLCRGWSVEAALGTPINENLRRVRGA